MNIFNPNVSIITPCFNSDAKLIKTIQSVQSQTYQNYEHIIIDDCSTSDLSKDILEIIQNDNKIKYIRRTWNAGAAVTRNRGISEAQGKYIAFLDSDDIWLPEKLEKQIEFMEKNNLALSYTNYSVVNDRGTYLGDRISPKKLSYLDLLRVNRIGCLTAMYNVDICGKQYMPNILKRQDYGLWLQITKKYGDAKGLNETLAEYTVSKASLSGNKFKVLKYQWRIYREVEKIGLLKSCFYFCNYAVNGLIRKV